MNRIHLFILAALPPFSAAAQTQTYPIGSTVANFTTLDTDGIFHTLYDYTSAGKTVILDFFFYDCIPCQENAPAYSELHEKYGCNQGGLVCFAVNSGVDNNILAEQFSVDFGGDFAHPPTIGQFNGGLLTDIFGVPAFPTVCVIGPDNIMWNDNVFPLDLFSLETSFPENAQIFPMSCTVGINGKFPSAAIDLSAINTNGLLSLQVNSPRSTRLQLSVLDVLGRAVFRTDLGLLPSGQSTHAIQQVLASGIYLISAQADGVQLPAVPIQIHR